MRQALKRSRTATAAVPTALRGARVDGSVAARHVAAPFPIPL
jgi:hypothetical protein